MPYKQGSDIIQSRKFSRWGVDVVNLSVPENFLKMYGVSIVVKDVKRIKNLSYYSKDGEILIKEYREGMVDRFFSGYLEVKSDLMITPPHGTECDKTYSPRT